MEQILDYIHNLSFGSMIIRLLIASLAGLLIGMDREKKSRAAGLKTHLLICLGACMAMMLGEYVMITFGGAKADIVRLGAQVISGISFIGAGTIMFSSDRVKVKGLTTAAGLWACACTGLAFGIGYFEAGIVAVVIILITQRAMPKIEKRIKKKECRTVLYCEFKTFRDVVELTNVIAKRKDVHIINNSNKQDPGGENRFAYMLTLAFPSQEVRDSFIEEVNNYPFVAFSEIGNDYAL